MYYFCCCDPPAEDFQDQVQLSRNKPAQPLQQIATSFSVPEPPPKALRPIKKPPPIVIPIKNRVIFQKKTTKKYQQPVLSAPLNEPPPCPPHPHDLAYINATHPSIEKQQMFQLKDVEHLSKVIIMKLYDTKSCFALCYSLHKTFLSHHSQNALLQSNSYQDLGLVFRSPFYDAIAKRTKDSVKLLITQQRDQHLEQRFCHPGSIFLPIFIPFKPERRPRFCTWADHPIDQCIQKNSGRLGSYRSKNQSPKSLENGPHANISLRRISSDGDHHSKGCIQLETYQFSKISQVRIEFFDTILVHPPCMRDHHQSLDCGSKEWLQNFFRLLGKVSTLQKVWLILPPYTRLDEIMDIYQQFICSKVQDMPLEIACSLIDLEVQSIYLDLNLTHLIVRKNPQDDSLVILAHLVCELFQIDCLDEKFHPFLNILIQRMRRIPFKEYMVLKQTVSAGKLSKKIFIKIIREYSLFGGDQNSLAEFGIRFGDFTRVQDEGRAISIESKNGSGLRYDNLKTTISVARRRFLKEYVSNLDVHDNDSIRTNKGDDSFEEQKTELLIPSSTEEDPNLLELQDDLKLGLNVCGEVCLKLVDDNEGPEDKMDELERRETLADSKHIPGLAKSSKSQAQLWGI